MYPLVTHWIVESVLCSSTASVGSDTFTTVASSCDINDPRIATVTIFQMPAGSASAAPFVMGSVLSKCCDYFIR
jgi:hypothetical protein